MNFHGPLACQWRVVLNDGHVLGIWCDGYSERGEHYIFSVDAKIPPNERDDPGLAVSSGANPRHPGDMLICVARIPIDQVADIATRDWDD